MKRISLILFSLLWILTLSQNQLWCQSQSGKVWQQANIALKSDNLDQALHLYRKVLVHSQVSDNLPGEVDALEAIALVYKKQEKYALARYYCQKSLRTGSPTFRSYYLLAQIAYE